eukprot:scaffold2857_cov344-Pavlova_lutheri.AAC.17
MDRTALTAVPIIFACPPHTARNHSYLTHYLQRNLALPIARRWGGVLTRTCAPQVHGPNRFAPVAP